MKSNYQIEVMRSFCNDLTNHLMEEVQRNSEFKAALKLAFEKVDYKIGGDAYGANAASAVEKARELMR